jgi:CPA1 family monovalent cation:H+ antiporter
VLISLLAVVVSGFVARATRLPLPLVQIALGAAIALSSLASVVLDPEVFFVLFLPPMLFLDGWRIPKEVLFRDASAILRLALGLVVFTVLGMGWFIHWLIPAMPLAVAFALAAVISPTDPIAVSDIAARSPIPRRLMHILQGESLLNDASGLVCMRFAVAAALTGSFSLGEAVGTFLWVTVSGLVIGTTVTLLVARATSWVSARFGEDGGAQILVTLLIPSGVYLLAEQVHGSGILAAVAAGVTMSFTDIWPWRAATRLRRTAVWDLVQFAANGSIFVLLGEQIPALVAAAPQTVRLTEHEAPGWLAVYVVVILLGLLAMRFVWVWASLWLTFPGRGGLWTGWRVVLVMSLAGVRGAVTLAGVLTLPVLLASGAAFPARELAISLAAGVIVLSLVLASVALPATLRGLRLPAEPSLQVAEDGVRRAAAEVAVLSIEAAQRALAEGRADAYRVDAAAQRIVDLYRPRIARYGDDEATSARRAEDDDLERRFRLVGLRAERAEVLRIGRERGLGDVALRRIVRELDHLEARYGG